MSKKVIFLILLLALPIAIFLFLKSFGRNEFNIPVYYEQGREDSLLTICPGNTTQYTVNNPAIPQGGIKVVHFEQSGGTVLQTRFEQLERVQEVFYDDAEISLNTFLNERSISQKDITDDNKRIRFLTRFWKINTLDSVSWANLKDAMVMAEPDNRVILVDDQNRIRGYYNILERDEMDRLILELRILKSNKN